MKFKFVLSLFLLGGAFSVFAQGYKDGVEYYNVNQLEKARILLQRNLDKPETNKAQSFYYLGRIELSNGKSDKAKEFFDKGIAANEDDAYNYVGIGAISLKAGNKKEAESNFKSAVSKGKKDAKLYIEIARIYYMVDPVLYAKEIENYIKKAKKTDKKDPAAYIFEGDMLTAQKKWGDAAGYYEMAESYDNNCSEAYVKYANTYFNVSPKVAIKKLEELVAVNPNSALAHRELAEKLYEDDQWTNAAKVYGEYIKNPNHFKEDEERYSVLLYFGENYQESFDLASKILSTNPNSFLMKRMVFLNKAALKDFEAADKLAQNFFGSTNPENKYSSNDFITYSDVLKALNRPAESLTQIEKAVEINPEKTELLKDLSSAYGSNEDYEKSALYYQKYVDAGDYSTNDLFVLAGKYQNVMATAKNDTIKTEALNNAIKYIDIVIEKVPEDYRIQQRKARILMVSEGTEKKTGKALNAYKAMLGLLDKDAENKVKNADAYKEAYNYIAGYELEMGNKAGAKEFYLKFLELDPTNTALKEYIDKLK
ncbi:MAG: hypothetical protein PHR45_01860 [Muribaculaceae bacterium]|nr:hypothetical protein [Muribaculaceae bacterium]